MTHDEIPHAARELINRHLRSMDHAEAALYLAAAADEAHRAELVAAEHRWSHAIANQVLADLTDSGLAVMDNGTYRIDMSDGARAGLAELAELYHKRPVALVRAIYAAPVRVKPFLRAVTEDGDGRPSR